MFEPAKVLDKLKPMRRHLTLSWLFIFMQVELISTILLNANALLLLKREARFTTFLDDWAFIGAGVAKCVVGIFLGWFFRNRRQLAMACWLGTAGISALLVLAFPFVGQPDTNVELCDGDPVIGYADTVAVKDSLYTPRVFFLVLTVIMTTLSLTSLWVHGVTYLDDHEPTNGAYYYGLLISIRLSVGLNADNFLATRALQSNWWEAQLLFATLVIVFAVLIALYPKQMENHKDLDPHTDESLKVALLRILRNKVIMVQSLGLGILSATIYSFVKFDKDYVQARFHVESVRTDPQTSRSVTDLLRSLVIILFVFIFRVRFSVRRSDGVKSNTASRVGGIVAIFVATFLVVVAALHCEQSEIGGVVDGVITTPACSQSCGCNAEKYGYTPVCQVDTSTTYISPCHAGCPSYENLNGMFLFHNCSCGEGTQRAVRGSCSLPNCRLYFNIYVIFFTASLAVAGAAIMMQGMVIIRACRPRDKSLALGVAFAFIGLFVVPIYLLFMFISDRTCMYRVSEGSSCVFNSPTLWAVPAVSAGLALVSACISLFAARYKQPTISISSGIASH